MQNPWEFGVWDYISTDYIPQIQSFSCKKEPKVERFLKEEAQSLHTKRYAITRLYFDQTGQKIIGFFTLYNCTLVVSSKKKRKSIWDLPDDYTEFPSVKLHYIGIDDTEQGKGYGRELLLDVFEVALNISKNSGCNFITVEALINAIDFYKKHGFVAVGKIHSHEFIEMTFFVKDL